MEASPSSIVNPPAPEAAGIAEPGTRRAAARRKRFGWPFASDVFHTDLDADVRLRLRLQRRAQRNLRRHVKRGAVRISVLLLADVAAFAVMRTLLRLVRDHAALGGVAADQVGALMPPGALSGWQFAAALLLSLVVTGNYGQGDRRRDVARLFAASALAVALPLWMELWNRRFPLVVVEYALTTVLVWVGLLAERFTIDRMVAVVRPPERDAPRTLFVGPAERCRTVSRMPVFATGREYLSVGFVDTDRAAAAADALGSIEDLPRVLHDTSAEAVVVCGTFRDGELRRILEGALAAGCQMISMPRTLSIAGVRPTFVWRDGEPLVVLTAPALRAQQLIVKRMVDVAAASLGLVLLSPLGLLIGFLVRLDSRGPALFRQRRLGFGGGVFGVVKFRTMVDGADSAKASLSHLNQTGDSRLFKIPNDPRVTRLGRFLRRWSLDEIPQLWNVLVGDMSLVGPRPFFPQDLKEYEAHHLDRLGVKPGLTGLWQVSGRSAITDFEEVVRLDREYIDQWTLWLDLKIIVRTIPAVLRRHGAY